MHDILLNGLPAIAYKNQYLVFSPFIREIAILSPKEINDPKIINNLFHRNFFENPKINTIDPAIANITLHLTNKCNMRCKYCYFEKKQKSMTSELALKIIKKAINKKTKLIKITFFGGEPTLNFNVIKSVVNYTKKLKIPHKFHIPTNGVIPKKILNYLIKNKFSFNVSYDGLPEIHDFQRPFLGNKKSAKIIENTIKELIKNKIVFKVKSIITAYNVKKMPEIVEYLAKLNVKNIELEKVHIIGEAIKHKIKKPSAKEFIKYFLKAKDKADKLGVNLIHHSYTNLFQPSTFYCTHLAGQALMVNPDKEVCLCYENFENHDQNSDFVVGNLENINKIKLRKMKNFNVNLISECNNCFAKYICSGGCPYRNFTITGSIFMLDKEECKIKKTLIKDAIIRMYKN